MGEGLGQARSRRVYSVHPSTHSDLKHPGLASCIPFIIVESPVCQPADVALLPPRLVPWTPRLGLVWCCLKADGRNEARQTEACSVDARERVLAVDLFILRYIQAVLLVNSQVGEVLLHAAIILESALRILQKIASPQVRRTVLAMHGHLGWYPRLDKCRAKLHGASFEADIQSSSYPHIAPGLDVVQRIGTSPRLAAREHYPTLVGDCFPNVTEPKLNVLLVPRLACRDRTVPVSRPRLRQGSGSDNQVCAAYYQEAARPDCLNMCSRMANENRPRPHARRLMLAAWHLTPLWARTYLGKPFLGGPRVVEALWQFPDGK